MRSCEEAGARREGQPEVSPVVCIASGRACASWYVIFDAAQGDNTGKMGDCFVCMGEKKITEKGCSAVVHE